MKNLLAILFLFVSSIGFAQHQFTTYVTASGTNTYAVTVSVPTIANYSTKRIHLRFANPNNGASTLNVTPSGASALGAVAIRAWDGDSWEPLAGGEIATDQDYMVVHNGTYFELYPSISGGGGGSGEFEYSMQTISGTTHTIDAAALGILNKWFIYTNASGCTVTMDDDVDIGRSVVGQRGPTAGTVTFDDNGTSVLITASGDFDLEAVNRIASWTKQTSTDWHGVGELGPAAASALTDGEGTTANGSAADLGGAVTTTRTFTGTGNWNWGSDATPYSGLLVFKGLYDGSVGGVHFQVRDASTRYSLFDQSGNTINMSVRDASSTFERTSILLDGSSNGGLTLQANNNLLLRTFSNNVNLILDADDGISMKLGSDATGDMYYRNSSGFLTRLPVGSDTEVLTLVSGLPSWEAGGGGGSGTVNSGTAGQLAYYAGSGTAVSGTTTGTGVLTALGVNTGSSGAFVVNGGALGTPSSGTGTNITGIPYANLTGTAPFWSLASGGTLTGANTITGSTSNTFKMVFPSLGSTYTEGAGIFLENTTAAALGAQQEAPNIVLGGYAWNSGTSANHSVKVRLRLTPVQSSSTVSGNYAIGFSINGGAYSDGVTFSSNAGTNRITSTGLSTGSTSFSLRAEDSGNVALFRVRDDGALLIGNAGSPAIIAPINNSTTTSKTGPALHFSGSSGTAAHHIFNNTSTSPGNITTWRASIANSSGNTNTLVRRADVTINNTSTYTGIFAYDYFDPTATSLTGTDPYYLVNTNVNFKTVLGAATGNSTLDVDGSFAADITATSTDITLGITHHTVVVDASGAARTITLPAAASTTRRIYYIINDTGTNTVTVDGNASEVIGSAGATTYVIPAVAGNAVQIQSNGTKWLILSTL